jgi:hypothetical protein
MPPGTLPGQGPYLDQLQDLDDFAVLGPDSWFSDSDEATLNFSATAGSYNVDVTLTNVDYSTAAGQQAVPVRVGYEGTIGGLSISGTLESHISYSDSGTVTLGTMHVDTVPGHVTGLSFDFNNDSDIMVEVGVALTPVFDF